MFTFHNTLSRLNNVRSQSEPNSPEASLASNDDDDLDNDAEEMKKSKNQRNRTAYTQEQIDALEKGQFLFCEKNFFENMKLDWVMQSLRSRTILTCTPGNASRARQASPNQKSKYGSQTDVQNTGGRKS